MVSFEAQGRVVSEMLDTKEINTRKYGVFKAEVADLVLTVLFDMCNGMPEEGSCFVTSNCWLSNMAEDSSKRVGLVVSQFKIIPEEDYVPMSCLRVKVNGRVYKLDDYSEPKRSGANHVLFMSSKLRVKNEIDKMFNLTVVGIGKSAYIVNSMEDRGFYNVVGVLRKRTDKHNKFKLYVDEVEKC